MSTQGPDSSDEALVRRAQRGDDTAFRLLVDRRMEELTVSVRKMLPGVLRRKVSGSDVVQAALFTAYRKLPEFEDRGEGSFLSWLRGIVEFKIRDLVRRYRGSAKRGVDREISGDRRPETGLAPSREPSPSSHAIAGEIEERVVHATSRLPEDYRLVIRLVRDEGLGLAEVGERMGRSVKAVSKLYGRAVGLLTRLVFEGERDGE